MVVSVLNVVYLACRYQPEKDITKVMSTWQSHSIARDRTLTPLEAKGPANFEFQPRICSFTCCMGELLGISYDMFGREHGLSDDV